MSLILKDTLPSNNPAYAWTSRAADNIRNQSTIRSVDFRTTTNVGGSHLSLHPKYKYNPPFMHYHGEWNPTSSFNVGDVVRVLPDKTYNLPWDPSVPVEHTTAFSTVINQTYPAISGKILLKSGVSILYSAPNFTPVPGSYVCVAPVPSFEFIINYSSEAGTITEQFDAFGRLSDTSNLFVKTNYKYYRWHDVNYYPVWPEKDFVAYFDPGNLNHYKGRYWELLSLLPSQTQICINGLTQAEYTDTQTIPSGSANTIDFFVH